MKNFESADAILDFAIKEEEKAYNLYKELAGKMDNPEMKKAFEDFAQEELGHKSKLQSLKEGGQFLSDEKVMDLKLADFMVDVKPTADMDYQHALIFVMKKEKAAFKLYNKLSEMAEEGNLKRLLKSLANEEAKHKLKFEVEYDDVVLKED